MMNTSSDDKQPRDAAYWAQLVSKLKVSYVPEDALNLNVDGMRLVGPLQGFGQMWQKTYRISLKGASMSAAEVITIWKANFPRYWPKGNRFYGPLTSLMPGEVALLNLSLAGGMKLSTGVMVLYADDESFTLMTPQGHMFAAWNTFSAFNENTCIIVQIQVLLRANDPLYEIALYLGGHQQEDAFWQQTLRSLAAEFGVHEPVQTEVICVDPHVQWLEARNIWQNAAIRTVFYSLSTPARWLMHWFNHRSSGHQR